MCFTPIISLGTFIFEFLVATFILLHYRKSSFGNGVAIFIYLLGIYQFSEYMLCTAASSVLWAKIGFMTYTFLPAVGLAFSLSYMKKKYNMLFVFIIPIVYALIAWFKTDFIIETSCGSYFVVIKYLFSNTMNILPLAIYFAYYFGFITFIIYLFFRHYITTHNRIKKKIDLTFLIAFIVSLFPAVILFMILPTLSMKFPSIYCEFAVIFTIAALIAFHLDSKK